MIETKFNLSDKVVNSNGTPTGQTSKLYRSALFFFFKIKISLFVLLFNETLIYVKIAPSQTGFKENFQVFPKVVLQQILNE